MENFVQMISYYMAEIDPLHATIETIFVLFIVYLLLQKSYKIKEHPEKLTEREIDQLVEEWEPEPLVPPMSKHQKWADKQKRVVVSAPSTTMVMADGNKVLNFATTNFLGMADAEDIKDTAREAIQFYGVGACGPRGFYGSTDKHIECERLLATFMRTEEAIIYSAGFATSASAIPAFAKVFDIIFCDEGVSHSIQTGILLSRSKVVYFRHNDVADLKKKLEATVKAEKNAPPTKQAERKFVIIEGLYQNFGDIAPLKEILKIQPEFKFRIFMDDSFGIGTLGKTGRGTCEYWGVDPMDIDILTSSLSHAFGTIGGFCVGKRSYIFHQRLMASGYVYSASSPPYLVAAGVHAIEKLDENSAELIPTLKSRIARLHKELEGLEKHGLKVRGTCKDSPVVHIEMTQAVREAKIKELEKAEKDRTGKGKEKEDEDQQKKKKKKNIYKDRYRLKETPKDKARHHEEVLLQEITDLALTKGVLLMRTPYAISEKFMPVPSIRLAVCINHKDEEIKTAMQVLRQCASQVLDA